VFMIGIDPHKGSHTAAAVDQTEAVVACLRVAAHADQRAGLLEWAAAFEPRVWAVGGDGDGGLVAKQLVAAGERVLDVPPCRLWRRQHRVRRGMGSPTGVGAGSMI